MTRPPPPQLSHSSRAGQGVVEGGGGGTRPNGSSTAGDGFRRFTSARLKASSYDGGSETMFSQFRNGPERMTAQQILLKGKSPKPAMWRNRTSCIFSRPEHDKLPFAINEKE